MNDVGTKTDKKHILLKYKSLSGKKFLRFNVLPKKKEPEIQTGYFGIPFFGPSYPQREQVQQEFRQPMQHMPQEFKLSVPHEPQRFFTGAGIQIPDIKTEVAEAPDDTEDKSVNIKYPLIPQRPKKGEKILSYAHLVYSPKTNEIIYNVIEPGLDEENEKILKEIKEYIQEKLDINFAQIRKKEAINYLIQFFEKSLKYFRFKISEDSREILKYYILRDFIGLEKIEPLMNDRNIEDISCDGFNIPLYVYHRDPKIGSVKTNIIFHTRDELDSFVNKISERCGKTISVTKPLLDGTLPDGSRVQATLGTDIARQGSNFTIRMFTEDPLTPVDLIKNNTTDLKSMAYFWTLVENGFSILISGGTATGKTSLLNVISLFIKPQMKIVSIEDTAELRLSHPHWVPEVARTAISEEGKVDMFELLKESLRQRPDYIIVGEVRGKEAYVLFQQMAVGHAGLSTIHAENFPKLIDRLVSPPISLPANLIQNLDLIVFLKRVRRGRRYQRRIESVIEVLGFDTNTREPVINEIMRWDSKTDTIKVVNRSYLMKKIADSTNRTEKDLKDDINNKSNVLGWLRKHNIIDYRKISSVINLYYTSPEFLLGKIEGGV